MAFLSIYCHTRKVNPLSFKNTASDKCGHRYKDANNDHREVLFKPTSADIGRLKSPSEPLIRPLNLVPVIELVTF